MATLRKRCANSNSVLLLSLALATCAAAAAALGSPMAATLNLPEWVREVLRNPQFAGQYEPHFVLNPYYQRGDFDGDGKPDIAVMIRQRTTRLIGIALIHRATKKWHIVGAGTDFGNGGTNFDWLDAWYVESRGAADPSLRGEALYVAKTESASALIYWDGRRYRWLQQDN